MAGGIVGGIVGNLVGNMVSSIFSQFSTQMLGGALTNLLNGAIGNAIKGVIDQLPLPQFIQDAAKNVVDSVIGQNSQNVDPCCQDAVNEQFAEQAKEFEKSFMDMLMESVMKNHEEECSSEAKKSGGGDNWLVALAKAMADIQTTHLNKMLEASDTMQKNVGDSEESREKFIDAQGEFQAEAQLFKMASEAASTAIKSIGEGLSSIARKQ